MTYFGGNVKIDIVKIFQDWILMLQPNGNKVQVSRSPSHCYLLGGLEALKVAVRSVPVPEMPDVKLPPSTEISSRVKELPGSSRNTKVMVVDSSAVKEVFSLSMVSGVSRV